MARLSDKDWELVNAFHDGELSAKDAKAFQKRVRQDADLAAALADISRASASLKPLRPDTTQPQHRAVLKKGVVLAGALAACIAVFAFADLSSTTPPLTPLDLHLSLQERAFAVTTADIRNVAVASQMGVHDLSGANLTPVFAKDIEQGHLAHYAGVNGCRLSYFKGEGTFELPSGIAAQAIAWTTTDGAHHAIIATGMDFGKFDAIAAYLQHITHDLAQQTVYAALQNATENAMPCVG